jgi:hypothetical protein
LGFVYKAHPAAHIEIRVGGCNAVDGPKDKQDVELFFAGTLNLMGIFADIYLDTFWLVYGFQRIVLNHTALRTVTGRGHEHIL